MITVPREVLERARQGIADIKRATIEGRVCDDVAWYDDITTLHDFCDQLLNATEQAALMDGADREVDYWMKVAGNFRQERDDALAALRSPLARKDQ